MTDAREAKQKPQHPGPEHHAEFGRHLRLRAFMRGKTGWDPSSTSLTVKDELGKNQIGG